MQVPSAECQHLEAWPASTYGNLRGVSLKIVLANNVLFAGTVSANNLFVSGIQNKCIDYLYKKSEQSKFDPGQFLTV